MSSIVTFGEIMMRLATPAHQRFSQATQLELTYGGGEANVAVSLAHFGMPVRFVTRLPKTPLGDAALATLRGHGVAVDHIVRGGDRLGIYFLETGSMVRASQVVYDRAASAIATIEPGAVDWERAFSDASWFHWTGITPAIASGTTEVLREALTIASAKGLTISCDLNYRAKLWKWGKPASDVMPELVQHCDVILGNEEDADKVFGIRPAGVDVTQGHVEPAAYESVGRQLMERFPKAKRVVITLRGSHSADHNSWSGVLWDGTTLFTAPTYQLADIVDRVGGGDSFMAGLIKGLSTFGDDLQRALRFAVAASALKHTIRGDFNLVTTTEVEKLMGGDASGRVVR